MKRNSIHRFWTVQQRRPRRYGEEYRAFMYKFFVKFDSGDTNDFINKTASRRSAKQSPDKPMGQPAG
jgi:hypothetical protein